MKRPADRCERPRGFWAAISGVVGLVLACGCESATFVPPPPKELSEPALNRGVAQVDGAPGSRPVAADLPPLPGAARDDGVKRPIVGGKIVELILARAPNADRTFLSIALRREAGRAHMSLRYTKPEPGETFAPERLASAIRRAMGRGSSVLIIEPLDDPTVVDLLDQARGRGIAVIALDRPVPTRNGKPIPYIRFEPFSRQGEQLMAAVLEAARLTHSLESGRTVILHHRRPDPDVSERLASLTGPLEKVRHPFEVVAFTGDRVAADQALRTALGAPTRVAIVIADDDEGLGAAIEILDQRAQASQPEFLVAGYIVFDTDVSVEIQARCAALAGRPIGVFAAKAFQAARELIDGKDVGERIEVSVPIYRRGTFYVPVAAPKNDERKPANAP